MKKIISIALFAIIFVLLIGCTSPINTTTESPQYDIYYAGVEKTDYMGDSDMYTFYFNYVHNTRQDLSFRYTKIEVQTTDAIYNVSYLHNGVYFSFRADFDNPPDAIVQNSTLTVVCKIVCAKNDQLDLDNVIKIQLIYNKEVLISKEFIVRDLLTDTEIRQL